MWFPVRAIRDAAGSVGASVDVGVVGECVENCQNARESPVDAGVIAVSPTCVGMWVRVSRRCRGYRLVVAVSRVVVGGVSPG